MNMYIFQLSLIVDASAISRQGDFQLLRRRGPRKLLRQDADLLLWLKIRNDSMPQSETPGKRRLKRVMMLVIAVLSPYTVQGFSVPRRRACFKPSRILSPCLPSVGSCRHSWLSHFWRIRGGGAFFGAAQTIPSSSDHSESHKRERGMTAALFSTYFCVMGAKCALPSVLSLLLNPKTGLDFTAHAPCPPQQLMARQLTIATMAVAFGKLLLGPFIDAFGGITSLQVALTALALLLASIASCHAFLTFAVCWVFVDFIFSSCWAACISAIHESFPEQEWAGKVGMLAAAARTGNAAAFSVFSGVLHYTRSNHNNNVNNWRLVFWVSAMMQLIPITLLSYFTRFDKDTVRQESVASNSRQSSSPSLSTSVACLKREAATPEFWFHFVSRSTLMVFGSFLLFVPTLMTNCYGATSAFGAQVGSIFALGCLLSVTFGSQRYSTLSKKHKIGAIIVLLGTATLSALAQLANMRGVLQLSANASAFLLFLWGLCFAVPFYIPPSLYALSRGGKTSSATIADVFDFGGFGLLAIFNGYVASIRHDVLSAWIPTFEILSFCSLLSLVALSLAVYFE